MMPENCNGLFLMDEIKCKGKCQIIVRDIWRLEQDILKIARFQAGIINPQVEVLAGTTLISANLMEEIETINSKGLCSMKCREIPVSAMITTPGSQMGMSGKVTWEIEDVMCVLSDPVTVKISVVILWKVLILYETECCPCRRSGYFEKSGTLLLTPAGVSAWEDISGFEIVSFIIYNPGPAAVQLLLEGSPNQIRVFHSNPGLELGAGLTDCLVPKFFSRYLRLAGTSMLTAEVDFWFQAKS
jgi:hypothetical protein